MAVNPATQRINVLVSNILGSEFRADWRLVGIEEDSRLKKILGKHRIILERSEFPEVVACFSVYLPAFVKEPTIVAKMSSDGGRLIVSEEFRQRFSYYAKVYSEVFGRIPKITSYKPDFFLESLRSYGNAPLSNLQ